MKRKLSIHEKINFRSNFRPENKDLWFSRLMRPIYHSDMIRNDERVTYSTTIPFWIELTTKCLFKELIFKSKF